MTKDNPIKINLEDFAGDAVGHEYFLLNKIFGPHNLRWHFISQRLDNRGEKRIDCIKIFVIKDKIEKSIYFDVTDFF